MVNLNTSINLKKWKFNGQISSYMTKKANNDKNNKATPCFIPLYRLSKLAGK